MRISALLVAVSVVASGFAAGCSLLPKSPQQREVQAAGVNEYLWRATLDTLRFMPLADADPFGGTYVTEWHASPERPTERFKVQVYVLDTRLRADGIAVQVFRQTRQQDGNWQDASVDPDTTLQIENAILTKARQLRIADMEGAR
jgi:Domain of unknown function (DUF3576)